MKLIKTKRQWDLGIKAIDGGDIIAITEKHCEDGEVVVYIPKESWVEFIAEFINLRKEYLFKEKVSK